MGCGSSQPAVAPEREAIPNGNVKRETPPPVQQIEQPEQHAEETKKESPKEKRTHSAKSKSSSSTSRSSASSKRSRPETAPGGNTPAQVDPSGEPANKEIAQNTNEENHSAEAPGGMEAHETVPSEATSNQEGAETSEHDEPNFNKDVLKEFVNVENQIRSLEAKATETGFQTKNARLVELHKTITAASQKVEELKAQTVKEYQDVLDVTTSFSVRSFFVNEVQLNAEIAKEKQEYLDALNRQEVAQQQLNVMNGQYRKLYDEVIAAKKDQEELGNLRLKEEELLGHIFNDSYGSDKEWKLEMELDLLDQRKERIQAAYYRWHGARVYLDAAVKQLSWSTRRWAQISTHNVQHMIVKYQMVVEVRNHLIAASQNINTAHQNIAPINPPYCTKQDLDDLQTSTNDIFSAVGKSVSYQKSYNQFASMFSKSSHLHQWVDRVITETISKDLTTVKQQFHDKYFELKEERMTLIKVKVKEKLGVELELDLKKDELPAEEVSMNEDSDVAKPEEVPKGEGDQEAPEPDEQEGIPPEQPLPPSSEEATADGAPVPAGDQEEEAAATSKPMTLSELAPPPSEQDLFGDIDQLKKQHEEELAEFEKAQEMNKARVEQGLQEKLRARRRRRRKIQEDKLAAAAAAMPAV